LEHVKNIEAAIPLDTSRAILLAKAGAEFRITTTVVSPLIATQSQVVMPKKS